MTIAESYARRTAPASAVCAAVIACLTAVAMVVLPRTAWSVEVGHLVDKSRQQGGIRVIVSLRPPTLPDPASLTQRDYMATVRREVAAVQSAALARLPPGSLVGATKRFPLSAQFAAHTLPEGLTALAGNPMVTAIAEDVPEPAILDQSVPIVFPGQDTSSFSGSGWAVAVIDTGVDKHHDFLQSGARMKVLSEACYSTNDPGFGSSSLCPGGVSSSIAEDSALPCPGLCDHGTHVAGISVGDSPGLTGVATGADLIAVQVFSSFSGIVCDSLGLPSPCLASWQSDQILALQRIYELRDSFQIASVNMSLGAGTFSSFCDSDPRKPAIDMLRDAGIATIAASGNNGSTNGVSAPACISSAVAVGATTGILDQRASFSNNGPQLDLYAPGISILSSIPGGGFSEQTGTSMAAPHVAGAWAVLKQAYPLRSVGEIEAAFQNTGAAVTSNGITRQRINVDEALQYFNIGPGYSYYQISPCRIVDSRRAGGALSAGVPRHFIVSGTDLEFEEQGGEGDCGVPADAVAVVINITANQPLDAGNFKVFPFDETTPVASLLNFSTNLTIANATISPVCQPLCAKDITVVSAAQAHVIIDVMGYFR